MRVQDIVRNACPICGKEITPRLNHTQPIPKGNSIHIDVWIADRSKPRPFDHVRVD